MSVDRKNWCIVQLGEDYNWWVHEASDDINVDAEMDGILDPKQVDHMSDLLTQLRPYGLSDEIVNNAFISFQIEKETGKQMLRLVEVKNDVLHAKEGVFCLPHTNGDQEGPYLDFLDHITALRVKLLNANFNFKQPLNIEEIEDIVHEEQQERYISGTKMHAFDEIMSILDYVPLGYSFDEDGDEEEDDDVDNELDLSDFDDEIDDSLEIEEEKSW